MENGGGAGVFASDPNTQVRLNDCTMHHNGHGLHANSRAVVDLYGKNTGLHSNTDVGIFAFDGSKVQIHLPLEHNTSHDNTREDRTHDGTGSITNVK